MADRAKWTADQVERIFHAALRDGDAEGVEAAITLLLRLDQPRAIRLWDDLQAALRIVGAGQ